ncbi:MAG: hypothetical protein KAS23_10225 [Anaerohalosphaera sp.]|nr:hypothetical protein [Anaerohalosphaera sp.]
MKIIWHAIWILILIFISAAGVQADAAVYDFDDGTLQGWVNDASAGENYIVLDTSVNSNGGRTYARSGDYMLVEENFNDRDTDSNLQVLTSPEFMATAGTVIEIWTLGGTGPVATPTWSNYANLPATAGGGDFMGAALRRVSDGEYLLFSRRSSSGQGTGWLAIGWDTTEITAAVAGDSVNEIYVVDIIDAYTGGWGWIAVDDITLTDVVLVDENTLAFLTQPVKQIAPVGNEVEFDVVVYSSFGNVQYKWYKEGGSEVLSDTSELVFQVTEESEGYYYCIASDDQGQSVISNNAELEIGNCLGIPPGDINGDCRVDLLDFALLSQNWLVNNLVVPAHSPFDYICADFLNSLSDDVQVAAHRGNGFGNPENSLSTINSCIQAGVEVVEIDVRKTADGHLVLMHDTTINRTTTGSGYVSNLTLAQIKSYRLHNSDDEQVPTLEEVMLLVKDKCMVNLDKAWGIRADCLSVLQQTDTVDHAIFKSGGSATTLKSEIEALGDDINFMLIVSCSGTTSPSVESILSMIDVVEPQAIEIIFNDDRHPIMLPENTDLIRQRGTRVWVNTLWGGSLSGGHPDNSTATWEWMVQHGVTMMQTDYPRGLLDYLQTINQN